MSSCRCSARYVMFSQWNWQRFQSILKSICGRMWIACSTRLTVCRKRRLAVTPCLARRNAEVKESGSGRFSSFLTTSALSDRATGDKNDRHRSSTTRMLMSILSHILQDFSQFERSMQNLYGVTVKARYKNWLWTEEICSYKPRFLYLLYTKSPKRQHVHTHACASVRLVLIGP